jgi:hypothetical protein
MDPRKPGEPSRVRCALYHQLDARTYWLVHEDAERLEEPEEFRPMGGAW